MYQQNNYPPEDYYNHRYKKRRSPLRAIRDWVLSLVVALLLAIFITQVIIVNARIPTESMEDTINAGDRVIGFRLAYLFSPPERNDIIIFENPDNREVLYIKRVIAKGGDKLEIKEGKLFLNDADTPLDEPYLREAPYPLNNGPYMVPQNSYFVMGDNRNFSLDSRRFSTTYVSEELIVAKALFRIYPSPTLLH